MSKQTSKTKSESWVSWLRATEEEKMQRVGRLLYSLLTSNYNEVDEVNGLKYGLRRYG